MYNTSIVAILIIVVVLCALLASYFHKYLPIELFTATEEAGNIDDALINLKTATYFPYISDFVFSNTQLSRATFSAPSKIQIMNFLPTYADGLCSWNSNPSATCSNFYVNNISFVDKYDYMSPLACKSIETNISLDKSQCKVRALNNVYTLRKKCIRLNTSPTVDIYSPTQQGAYIATAANIGSATTFMLNIVGNVNQGNLDLLALLRPSLISFGNFGLFHCETMMNMSNNMMASYSSLRSNNNLVMSSVVPGTSSINLYPGTNNAIQQIISNSNWNILSTVYFMNYEEPVYPLNDDSTFNTMSFVLDSALVNSIKSMTTPLTQSTITLINTTTAGNLCNSITYTINLSPTAGDPAPVFFQLAMNVAVPNSTPTQCKVHADFSTIMYNFLNTGSLFNNTLVVYHICVTCTMDLVVIVAMVRDLSQGTTLFFITQTPLTNNGTPYYVQFQGDKAGKAYQDYNNTIANDQILQNHYNKFQTIAPNTAVPNFAMLAKNLGYII